MVDAAEVGSSLAFPDGLQGQMRLLANRWEPVEAAVAACWVGLETLRRVTAERNRSVAAMNSTGQPGGGVEAVAVAALEQDDEVVVADRREASTASKDAAPGPIMGGTAPVLAALAAVPGAEKAQMVFGRPVPRLDETGGRPGVAVRSKQAVSPEGGSRETPVTASERVGSRRDLVADGTGVPAVAVGRYAGPSPSGGNGVAMQGGSLRRAVAPMSGQSGFQANVTTALLAQAATGGDEVGAAAFDDLVSELGRASSPTYAGTGGSRGRAVVLAGGGREATGAGGLAVAGVAPQSAGQGADGQRQIASVVLDGRLVGSILSERMARDASRPGAGTTSFDARQMPAWTPSGAL